MTYLDLLDSAPKNLNIYNSLLRARSVLGRHRRIAVSVSGGSDSDTMMDLLELVKPENCELAYVFFDTGLEYAATKRQLDYLETKYGVKIERRRAKTTVAAACRLYGVPFISKDVSEFIGRLQTHHFDWNDTPENATPEKYGRCKSALDWYYDRRAVGSSGKEKYGISRLFQLKEFIISSPPTFKISEKCCDYAKKDVADEFHKEFTPDLVVTGMRQAEGGRRLGSIQTCFTPGKNGAVDNYRPLWYWSDADKVLYKQWRDLTYSDCYEVWGLKRTGCTGCPCNSKAEQELAIVAQYEPQLAKAAYGIFGESYQYRREYTAFKEQVKSARRISNAQISDSSINKRRKKEQSMER